MSRAYVVVAYRSITDRAALARYSELAGPVIRSAGGRFLVRGMPAKTLEAGLNERIVIVEFASVREAVAALESEGYASALAALGNSAERDIRIVESVD